MDFSVICAKINMAAQHANKIYGYTQSPVIVPKTPISGGTIRLPIYAHAI